MAFTLKARAELDASGFEEGARVASSALGRLDQAGEQAAASATRQAAAIQRSAQAAQLAATYQQQFAGATELVNRAAIEQAHRTELIRGQFEQLRRSLDPTIAAMEQLKATQQAVNLAMASGVTTQQESARVLAQAQGRYDAVARASARSSRAMGMGFQQAGYQVGDFAVQVASGQSAIIAFTQQGTQLLQFFGPLGSVLGAAAAVLGAVYVGTMRASEGIEETGEKAEEARKLIAKYTGDLQTLAQINFLAASESLRDEVDRLENDIVDLQVKRAELQRRLISASRIDEFAASAFTPDEKREAEALRQEQVRLQDEIGQTAAAEQNLAQQLDKTRQALANQRLEAEITGQSFDALRDKLDPLGAAARDYEQGLKALRLGLQQNLITEAEHSRLLDKLKQQYEDNRQAALEDLDTVRAVGDGVIRVVKMSREEVTELSKVITETPYDELIADLEAEIEAMGMSADLRAVENQLRAAENQLKAENIALSDQERQRLRDLFEERQRLTEAERESQEQLKDLQRRAEQSADEIVNFAGDAFADLFDETGDGWRGLMDDMLALARKTFAQIAAEAIIRPIIQPVVNTAMGLSANGQSVAGGSSITNVGSNLLSAGGQLLNGIENSFLGQASSSLFSAVAPGVFGTTAATLAGGATASSLGVAAVAGGATNVGIAAAAPLASVAPFILPALAIALPLIAGLFGPEPSNREQNAIIDNETGKLTLGGQTGDKFSQENRDAVSALSGGIKAIGDSLAAFAGTSLTGSLRLGIGDRDGIYAEWGSGSNNTEFGYGNDTRRTFSRDEAGIAQLTEYVTRAFVEELGENLPEAVRIAVDRIDWAGDLQQALSDLQFAANFGDIFGIDVRLVGQWEQAYTALNAQFEEATKTAERLGLAVEEVDRQFGVAAENMRTNFLASLNSEVLAAVNPAAQGRIDLNARYQLLLGEAAALGVATGEVDTWFRRMKELLEGETDVRAELAAQVADDLRLREQEVDTLTASIEARQQAIEKLRQQDRALLINPDLSPLSGRDQLEEARAQLEDAFQRAQGGDIGAVQEFIDLREGFLQLSRDYNSISDSYLEDFYATQDMSRRLQQLGLDQISIEQQLLAEAQTQTQLLAALVGANDNAEPNSLGSNTELNALIRQTSGFGGAFGGGEFLNYVGDRTRFSQQNFGANADLNRTLAVITNYSGDFDGAGAFQNYIRSSAATDAEREAARLFLISQGQVPGFAGGGHHGGGLRIVGENGPELEATGPSRILSNSELRDVIGGGDMLAVVRAVDEQTAVLKQGFAALLDALDGIHSTLRSNAQSERPRNSAPAKRQPIRNAA